MTADAEVTVRVTRVTEDRAYTVLLAMLRGLLPSKRLPVGRGADQTTPPERVWTAGFVAGLESFEALAEAGQSVQLQSPLAAPKRFRLQRIGLTGSMSARLAALQSKLYETWLIRHPHLDPEYPPPPKDVVFPVADILQTLVDVGMAAVRRDWAGVRGPAPRGRR